MISNTIMKNYPIIRTIYLYLFALVGLAMMTIGAAQIVDLGLKAWIFTQADRDFGYITRPPALVIDKELQTAQELKACQEKCELTETQKQQIQSWLNDYQNWQQQEKSQTEIDYKTQSRHRQAASALSLIIVGLPLWLYHWSVIKKDQKKREQEKEVNV